MRDSYECSMCGGVFGWAWSDQEAIAEMKQYFGNVPPEKRVIVCDDCYQKIHPAKRRN